MKMLAMLRRKRPQPKTETRVSVEFHIDEECSQCQALGLTMCFGVGQEHVAFICKPCLDEYFTTARQGLRGRDDVK